MPYLTNSIRLETLINTLPQQVRQIFAGTDLVTIAQNIGTKYELTFDEIDILYGIIADALEKKPPGDIAKKIEAGLEEDNKPQSIEVARVLIDDFFTRLETVQPGSKPILKQDGFPIKDGKVPTPIFNSQFPTTTPQSSTPETPSPRGLGTSPLKRGSGDGEGENSASVQRQDVQVPRQFNAKAQPLDERHLRALARIAAGTNHTEEQLIEQFQGLPEGLKRAITTVDTANAIQDIAKRFLLHIDQMAALASETGLVLLGLTHPRNFVKNLAARLRISEQRALEIAREVSEKILAKVREALRTLHENPPIPNTKYQIPKNQPQPSPIPNQKTQESPKKLGVLEEQEEKKVEPFRGIKVQPLRSETPYSAEAKWNTKDTKHGAWSMEQDEEKLTREEILRGIEEPTSTQPTTTPPPPSPLKRGGGEVVGPTGWRPPAAADGGKFQVPDSKFQESPDAQIPNIPRPPVPPPPRSGNTEYRIPEKTEITTPTQPSPPGTPSPRGLGTSPLKRGSGEGGEEEESFLEEKLAGPTGAAHTERRYTIDPYREPTD